MEYYRVKCCRHEREDGGWPSEAAVGQSAREVGVQEEDRHSCTHRYYSCNHLRSCSNQGHS